MKCNVGNMDRSIRMGLGLGALTVGVFGRLNKPLRATALVFGAMELFTAASRYCPVSDLLGVNTCKPEERAEIELEKTENELAGTGI